MAASLCASAAFDVMAPPMVSATAKIRPNMKISKFVTGIRLGEVTHHA
jgi:hypothetical protein